MATATTTIRQTVQSQPQHAAWLAATQILFNLMAAFSFEVIQAHEKILDLSAQQALTAMERLTHTTTWHQLSLLRYGSSKSSPHSAKRSLREERF